MPEPAQSISPEISPEKEALIKKVLKASGDMPSPKKHRLYLVTLDEEQLESRLAALAVEPPQKECWWSPKKPLEAVHEP